MAQAGDPALAKRLARAEQLLQQAEAQPARRDALVRQAADLTPDDACPTVRQAAGAHDRQSLQRARQEVSALRRAVTLTPAHGTPSADASKTLGTVLSGNEFQSLRRTKWSKSTSPAQKWLAKLGTWISGVWTSFLRGVGKLIGDFFRWIGSLFPKVNTPELPKINADWWAQMGAGMKTLLWVLLGVLILFLVGFITSHILASHRRRRAIEQAVPRGDGLPIANRKQEPTFWERSLTLAQEHWTAGDEREALRVLSRACLVLLDVRGMLRFDEARANGEVLRELRRQGRTPVAETLRPVVRSFDRSWYGFLPVSNDEFATVLEDTRRFRDTVVGEP
jgi:hypothetical protein